MKRSYIAVLIAIALAVGAVAPAAAQSDDGGILSGVVGEEDEDDPFLVTVLDRIAGFSNNVQKAVDSVQMSITGEDGNATQYADAVETTLEENNDSIRAYVNERVTAQDVDAVRVFFHDRDGNNVTRYIVADTGTDNWISGPSMLTPAEFENTNYTTDHWVSMDWFASKHADADLTKFVEDRVQPDEDVSDLRRARLLSKYSGSIKSSLWNDTLPSFGGE